MFSLYEYPPGNSRLLRLVPGWGPFRTHGGIGIQYGAEGLTWNPMSMTVPSPLQNGSSIIPSVLVTFVMASSSPMLPWSMWSLVDMPCSVIAIVGSIESCMLMLLWFMVLERSL